MRPFRWAIGWTCHSVSFVSVLSLLGVIACSDMTGPLPAGTSDPASFNTSDGAVSYYYAALRSFQDAFADYVEDSGLLTDELGVTSSGSGGFGGGASEQTEIDARSLPQQDVGLVVHVYSELQGTRATAAQAIGVLEKYAPMLPMAWRGELYALAGYAELFLGDLFCSGVPLSTLDFERDFTYHAGSPTAAVYQHAIALFDTALVLGGDSIRIHSLAQVGKGRALLALGRYVDAQAAVQGVSDDFQYLVPVYWMPVSVSPNLVGVTISHLAELGGITVSDREGGVGFPYRSSDDPRTTTIQMTGTSQQIFYFPKKYTPLGAVHAVVVADGHEARLIEAEAALERGDVRGWLTKLNDLRTAVGDTALPSLHDPGTLETRRALLFAERAAWLFLTGHRQGDLRRLVRNYHDYPQETVYPSGIYIGGSGLNIYGNDINVPIPATEQDYNPLFHGCLDREA